MNILKMFDGNVDCVMLDKELFENEIDDLFNNNKVSLEGVSIEDFDFDGGELFLCMGEGYRGLGCYEGLFKKNGKVYYIDVVNDGVVFDVVE